MNDYKELIEALNCGEYIVFKAGNAKTRQVTKYNNKIADAIEQLVKERDAAVKDLKMLEKHLGKAIPKRCKTCELWGKRGWSQFEIGYCEGDDNPHGPNDFCSRWRGVQ